MDRLYRLQKHAIAYHIGKGIAAAMFICQKVKQLRPNISHIYSDANNCYDVAFSKILSPEKHSMIKSQTHLIESSNSSIRDDLVRFNRCIKCFSKIFL